MKDQENSPFRDGGAKDARIEQLEKENKKLQELLAGKRKKQFKKATKWVALSCGLIVLSLGVAGTVNYVLKDKTYAAPKPYLFSGKGKIVKIEPIYKEYPVKTCAKGSCKEKTAKERISEGKYDHFKATVEFINHEGKTVRIISSSLYDISPYCYETSNDYGWIVNNALVKAKSPNFCILNGYSPTKEIIFNENHLPKAGDEAQIFYAHPSPSDKECPPIVISVKK